MAYELTGVKDDTPCPFCMDGRMKSKEVFEVRGPYSGPCCASHLAVLVRQQGPKAEPSADGHPQ